MSDAIENQPVADAVKPWWASKGVWGGLVAVAAGVAGAFGYVVSPEDQATVVEGIVALVGIFGGGLAVYGRIRASKLVK
jgi:hypothetical protein